MKCFTRLITPLVLSLAANISLAAEPDNHPGSLDINSIPFLSDQSANVEVTLSGPLLKMLAQLPVQYTDIDESEQELLRVIDRVVVRVYESLPNDTTDLLSQIEDTSQSLEAQNWMRIVRVREDDGSNVDIHVKVADDGENLNGIVVMALEGDSGDSSELVFVNIAGDFNPAYLSSLGGQFDIDQLDGVQMP